MNKLIWSAFAMSLVLSSPSHAQLEAIDEFLGLESEVLPELKGQQRFSPRDLHQKNEWNVKEAQVEVDTIPLKGQRYSLIPWETQDPQEWLSIDNWLIERSLKDNLPDWKLRLRDHRQAEHVGKVLQCKGVCEIYRGTNKARAQHLSRIDEGDEFKTEKDSVAWIYLMDGTLVRIGPDSSVAFQEINFSKGIVLHLVRLHQGHVFWHPRSIMETELNLSPETDAFSLPLLVREANQAHFEREIFAGQSDLERSFETAKLEENAIMAQIKKINELKATHNEATLPMTRVMMVAPNATIVSTLTSFDLFHYPGGKSHFKKRTGSSEFALNLRGYNDTANHSITDDNWYEIDKSGRSYGKVAQVTGPLEITELLTRRIKTFELAREIWLGKYTLPVLKAFTDPKELAVKHGYTLWQGELDKRYDFLMEYTRRMETTNLKSVDNLLAKLEASGMKMKKEMDDSHYQAALSYYLTDLKKRYVNKRMQVREMNDLQYYVWILRHGKTN